MVLWNVNLINELFCPESAKQICDMFWVNNDLDDSMCWVKNKNGDFTIKSFYWMENWNQEPYQTWWSNMWSSKIHERQKFLL